MYHSMQIIVSPKGEGSNGLDEFIYHTYRDFYLVPSTPPMVVPPKVKTHIVDIPGTNGIIDLTEALTPYPVYENRTGSWDFILLLDRAMWYEQHKESDRYYRKNYYDGNQVKYNYTLSSNLARDSNSMSQHIYSLLMNTIHGQWCRIIFDDDPEWYYEGRLAVNSWKSGQGGNPSVSIDYDLHPYKWSVRSSIGGEGNSPDLKWKWDSFNFMDDYLPNGENISFISEDGPWTRLHIQTATSWTLIGQVNSKTGLREMGSRLTGHAPITPTVTVTGNGSFQFKVVNHLIDYEYTSPMIHNSTLTDPECIFYSYNNFPYDLLVKAFDSDVYVTFEFRRGSL